MPTFKPEIKDVPLSMSYDVGGLEMDHIEFTEPTAQDLDVMANGEGEMEQMRLLIAKQCGLSMEFLNSMRARDFMKLMEVATDFLGIELPTPGK